MIGPSLGWQVSGYGTTLHTHKMEQIDAYLYIYSGGSINMDTGSFGMGGSREAVGVHLSLALLVSDYPTALLLYLHS